MAKVERTVTSHLTIKALCDYLGATEEQLLVNLVMSSGIWLLKPSTVQMIQDRATQYHEASVFTLEVEV